MKIAITQFALKITTLALKGIIGIYKIFILRPIKTMGRFLFRATLPFYDAYLTLKRIFIKFYSPLQKKNIFIHAFARRYFTHILIIIISFTVITSNLNALEVRDEIVPLNMLSSIVKNDDLGEIEVILEEGPVQEYGKNRYLENDIVQKGEFIDFDAVEEYDTEALTSGGAVVKHIFPPEFVSSQKFDAVEYTVQEGDTVSGIASQFGISINTILWENNLTEYTIIQPGKKLSILPVSGIRHKVASGETIAKISKKYSVSEEEIIEFNRLASANDIKIGERLIIPGGRKAQIVQTFSLRKIASPQSMSSIALSSLSFPGIEKLIWPAVCKRITQYFQWRHRGVDIACPKNSSIAAAADGVVVKAQGGWNGGYGIMILVDHGEGIQTLYGHLNDTLVKVGDTVKAGQTIGIEGSTGRSTGPHVHFEIRKSGQRVNPLSLIK